MSIYLDAMGCCSFLNSILTILRCVCAITTFLLDFMTDIAVGARYYNDFWSIEPPIEWAMITWMLVLLPGIVNLAINVFFLCQINAGADMPKWTATLGYFMSFLLLGSSWHNVVTIVKTCEGDKFSSEESDRLGAAQRTTQALLQSLPQLFFQIYIVSSINTVTKLQGFAILTSLLSIINASYLSIRVIKRKYHYGASNVLITILGTIWLSLLLLSGVPPIALFSALQIFGPQYSALLTVIIVYLTVLPLVFKTHTVFWKVVSTLLQLFYSSLVAVVGFLWYFNVGQSTDKCLQDNSSLKLSPTIFPFMNSTNENAISSNDTKTDVPLPIFKNLSLNAESSTSVIKDTDATLNFDRVHCLSDWSLFIIVILNAANALFFFYHMTLILVIRIHQQVSPIVKDDSMQQTEKNSETL